MAGNYSKLVTVITGQTITAAERNNEFDNVINNMTPDGVDDASLTLTAMQATADPSGGNAATSLRGELQRLRYQIKTALGLTNWYDVPTTVLQKVGGTMSGNIAMGTSKLTGLGAGSADGDSVRYEQAKRLWGYRKPTLIWGSITTVAAELGADGSANSAILFPDGDYRSVSSSTLRIFDITRNAALSGTKQSGLRSSLTEANNTWYALYAVKATDNTTDWVLVGDTVLPIQANYATLNTNFGTNGWVYLGMVRNGNNDDVAGDLLDFDQAGHMTIFTKTNSQGLSGIRVAQASATTLTFSPARGTGAANLPDNLGNVLYTMDGICGLSGRVIFNANSAGTVIAAISNTNTVYSECTAQVWSGLMRGCKIAASASGQLNICVTGWIDNALGVGSTLL